MPDKFTIRDFLVYFTSGFFALIVLFYIFNKEVLRSYSQFQMIIEKNSAIIIFLLLPCLYLLGQFIHGIDLIFFKIGRILSDIKTKRIVNNKKVGCLLKSCIKILNGYRVTGYLDEKNYNTHAFWVIVSCLQYEDKFDKAEYWYLMNDLNKALTLISFILSFYSVITISVSSSIVGTLLTIIFWLRARHMSVNFVQTTLNTASASKEPLTEKNIISLKASQGGAKN